MKKILFFVLLAVFAAQAGMAQMKKYTGAEIRTNQTFLYGRFEVKMKSCEASGMLISFFTFYDAPDFASNWNEIDIEILGRYQNEVQFNAIVDNHQMHEQRQAVDFNPHQDFHTYAFDWTPDYIAWRVDGKEVFRQTGAHITRMKQAQKIMMNIWPSEFWDWTGPWKEDKLPLTAVYDYVKYYKYNPKSSDTFELSWEDNFDRLDYTRWSFATHTFDGNACQFDPENTRIKDGFLNLSLTKVELESAEEETPEERNKGKIEIVSATQVDPTTVKITFIAPVNRMHAKKENFKIDGVEILKSKFAMDMTNLQLIITNLEEGKEYELSFTPSGTKDVQKIKIKKQ